jgi:asparagine synthase (glutamine-hydrolysing)
MTVAEESPARSTNSGNGLIGDFLIAFGPDSGALLPALAGFATTDVVTPRVRMLTRGVIRRHDTPHGGSLALADLIAGDLGAATLDGAPVQAGWRGRFAHVQWNAGGNCVAATADHFASVPLYALRLRDSILIASDLRLLLASPACSRQVDLESVYHYLNFGCIPAPRTICRDIVHIEPGTRLLWKDGELRTQRYYLPEYPEDLTGHDDDLAEQLLEQITASVRSFEPAQAAGWGCFLSGGTDSSSIVSLLARAMAPRRVDTFSIGFAERGYDELGYARTAAEACGARPFTAVVDSNRTLELLKVVVDAYDQPFGNASAIPTLVCAELAQRHGASLLLAGDGGDEIFGGNQRYAKDRVMEAYHRLPRPLRTIGGWIGRGASRSHRHLLQRVGNFVARASLPNPDRFYTDDSFASDYYSELLSAEFRAAVPRNASLDLMRDLYALGTHASPLHRIMRLDLLQAIAQNDLIKVHGACKAHGISVRFPYLDPALVAFTGRLPERHKVRGLDKRHLFKRAMRDVLPDSILRKKKQGFGLPVAVWLREDRAFRQFTRDVLDDRRTRARGWFKQDCIDRLLEEHQRGGWDHSAAIWQLVVLELWLRKHLDGT